MKKLLSLVVCLAIAFTMMLTLGACGGTTDSGSGDTTTPGDTTTTDPTSYAIVISGGTGSGSYEKDDECTATATIETGKEFVKWNDEDGNKVSEANPYTFTVTEATTLTAIFEDAEYDVVVNGGTLSDGQASGEYTYNDDATITATTPDDYTFLRWVNLAGDEVSTANPYTFAVTADTTLSAVFKAPDLVGGKAIVEVQNGYIKDTNSPFGSYDPNTSITVVAEVPTGYAFVGWVDADGTELGSELELTVTIDISITLIAKMAQITTSTFEAEGLDFTGLSTPAFSGTYSGTDMIFRASNYEGSPAFASSISNGYFIGATHEAGLTLTYTIVSDMDAKDASITLRLASQMRSNQSIDNDVFDVKINGTSLDYTAFTLNASTSDNYETPFVDFTLDATFDLVKGDNTISLVVMENDIAADWGGTYDSTAGPGIDNIKVTTYAGLTWPTDKWASNEAILNFGS